MCIRDRFPIVAIATAVGSRGWDMFELNLAFIHLRLSKGEESGCIIAKRYSNSILRLLHNSIMNIRGRALWMGGLEVGCVEYAIASGNQGYFERKLQHLQIL